MTGAPRRLRPQLHEVDVTETGWALITDGVEGFDGDSLPIVRRGSRRPRIDEKQRRFSHVELVSYD